MGAKRMEERGEAVLIKILEVDFKMKKF